MPQTTFTIEEFSIWLDTLPQAYLWKVRESLSAENIIKANQTVIPISFSNQVMNDVIDELSNTLSKEENKKESKYPSIELDLRWGGETDPSK